MRRWTVISESLKSICHNTLGSYHCECEEGYEGNGLLDCYVIDACHSITCGAYAHCIEEVNTGVIAGSAGSTAGATTITGATAGSLGGAHNTAKCICDPGFIPDPKPEERCKVFCDDGYQSVGPECLGKVFRRLTTYGFTHAKVKKCIFGQFEIWYTKSASF